MIKRYDFEISARCRKCIARYRERELAYKELFGEPQLLDFETIKISGHADPDAYLTKGHGDYMKLPDSQGHFESTWENKLESFYNDGVRIDQQQWLKRNRSLLQNSLPEMLKTAPHFDGGQQT